MRGVVLDAWAVLALLRGERPAGDVVRRYVGRTADGRFEVLLNVVNLGEVLYRLIQVEGRARAIDRFARFRRGPVTIVPAREGLVLEAAELKSQHALSYADAFAVATARQAFLPLVTGDPEILELPGSVVRVRRVVRHR